MVFNATFNNISVISWRSILLVEEIRVPGENHRPAASYWQTLSHNVLSTSRLSGIRILLVIGTDCIGINKSNYHTLTTTTAPSHSDGRLLIVLYIVSVKSSGTITSTQEEMKAMGGHIKNSQRLITKYDRRQFTDKLLIMLAVLFFFVTVLYIMKKRIW